jgi:Family of unknown function (DUF5946)
MRIGDPSIPPSSRYNAAAECLQHFHTLAGMHFDEADPGFIHQIAVDCYGAQHVGGMAKPVTAAFSLIGLCLHLEHGFSGRQVQAAHMALARTRNPWRLLAAPTTHYAVTVDSVLACEAAAARAQQIEAWAHSTWDAWRDEQMWVRRMIHNNRLAA